MTTMELLRALVERLDYVHDDPAYRAVWTVAHQHIGAYRGPTYTDALVAARQAVEADALHATAHPTPVQREPSEGEVWRANLENAWAALRMIREAVEEFGPASSLEGEDAVLLRGPEPVHEAEAIVEALGRLRAVYALRGQAEAVTWPIGPNNGLGQGYPSIAGSRTPQRGDKMHFINSNGDPLERDRAAAVFDPKFAYVVEECDVGEWRSKIKFSGMDGWWNSVMFDFTDTASPTSDTVREGVIAALEQVAEHLSFNSVHLIAEDDKADALHTLNVARATMAQQSAAIRAALEQLRRQL